MPGAIPVTVENFTRAESDLHFGNTVKRGGFGRFDHSRNLAAVGDEQPAVHSNRDVLYSRAVFDLDAGPVLITTPDAGRRFMSMQVIDQDHYTRFVSYMPGSLGLTRTGVGTRYVIAIVRTLVDPNDPDDMRQAHALQDMIETEQPGGPGVFETPSWDQPSQDETRDALLAQASDLPDMEHMFGAKDEVDPIHHLLGAAAGWGSSPASEETCLNITPARNDGKTVYRLSVKDVPVDGFWSVSVYNAEGYFEKNVLNAYSMNTTTAKKDADGSVTVQFGECNGKNGKDGLANCIPIMAGWNYIVRLYRPRAEILDGRWKFPEAQPVQ